MRKLRLLPLMASLLILAIPASISADVNDFTVKDFTADYYLSKHDPQGALDIRESIEVDFPGYNHGILRALPQKYNGQAEHLKVASVTRDGQSEKYTTYTSNGNKVLKIGDAGRTITGRHTYAVRYSVENVIRFTGSTDELDWNTNGTEWTQPFEHVTARLHLPLDLVGARERGFSCFTGTYGSKAQDCTVDASNGLATFTTNRTLSPGETMTFVSNYKLGTFQQPTAADWWHDHMTAVLELAGLPLLALIVAGSYWRKNGKDIKGRGTIIPEYVPPDGLKAAEVDTVAHYKPGKNAISATIIDLAIRKYIRIEETETNGVLGIGKHKDYTFRRLPPPVNDQLSPYEQDILSGLFPSGDTTEIAALKSTFYVTAKDVNKNLTKNLTTAGYFPRDPRAAGGIGHAIGAVMVFGGFYLFAHSAALAAGVIAAGLIVLGFATLMPRRTQKGVDAKDAIDGLKLYMNTAEKDRMAMLQSADAPYAPQSSEPTKTVELFEKLLPYAMVLGVEQSWGKQFASIYTTPPDWYGGNWTTFNALYLTSALSDSMSSMNSSFTAPSSSGSGSGGGFSGGGGGGGGGGGW